MLNNKLEERLTALENGVIYYYSDYLTLENNGTEPILVDGQKLYVKKEKFDISDFFLYYYYILLLISLIGREHLFIIMVILVVATYFYFYKYKKPFKLSAEDIKQATVLREFLIRNKVLTLNRFLKYSTNQKLNEEIEKYLLQCAAVTQNYKKIPPQHQFYILPQHLEHLEDDKGLSNRYIS